MTKMAVQIDSYYIKKIDRETQETIKDIPIDVPAMIVNDRTLVPARAISEALYADVQWDDAARKVNITLEYDTGDFYEGMAQVYKDGKRGFINEKRQVVIPIEYDLVYNFSNGKAMVQKNKKWSIIDKTGKTIIDGYDNLHKFGNYILAEKAGKAGIIDEIGNIIIPFDYDTGSYSLSVGYDNTMKDGYFILKKNGKCGVIDRTKKVIVPFEYHMVYGSIPTGIFMTERVMGIAVKNNYSFMDAHGKKITNEEFMDAHPFVDGVAPVRSENGWGFINSDGKIFVPTIYKDFFEGLIENSDGFNDFSYIIGDCVGVYDKDHNVDNIIWFDKDGNKVSK